MSVQVRVCMEVANSEDEDQTWIRIEQIETVIPANTDESDLSDVAELGKVTLSRLSQECSEKALDQIEQMAQLQGQAH